jgi:hypothetical protein
LAKQQWFAGKLGAARIAKYERGLDLITLLELAEREWRRLRGKRSCGPDFGEEMDSRTRAWTAAYRGRREAWFAARDQEEKEFFGRLGPLRDEFRHLSEEIMADAVRPEIGLSSSPLRVVQESWSCVSPSPGSVYGEARALLNDMLLKLKNLRADISADKGGEKPVRGNRGARNPKELARLAKEIRRMVKGGMSQRKAAEEVMEGKKKEAESLLRKMRRHKLT